MKECCMLCLIISNKGISKVLSQHKLQEMTKMIHLNNAVFGKKNQPYKRCIGGCPTYQGNVVLNRYYRFELQQISSKHENGK